MKKKFVIIGIIVVIVILNLSYVIYASTIEKTTITCNDENMYNALKSALNNYIMIGDTDKENLTIKIPTDSISQITSINLDNKQIEDITGLEKLTSLTDISLSKNNVKNINALNNLNNIFSLNLNENSELGTNIANVLASKTTITTLKVSNTRISDIAFVSNMANLYSFDASNNTISNISELESLGNLKELNLAGNSSLRSISSILRMTQLEKLNISHCGITTLETDSTNKIGIYKLTNLKELDVSGLEASPTPIVKKKR